VKRSKQPAHRRAKAEAYRLEQRLIRRNERLLTPPPRPVATLGWGTAGKLSLYDGVPPRGL
jgi:hypothetical protein